MQRWQKEKTMAETDENDMNANYCVDDTAASATIPMSRDEKREHSRRKYPDPNPLPEPLYSWRAHMKDIWMESDEKFHQGLKWVQWHKGFVFQILWKLRMIKFFRSKSVIDYLMTTAYTEQTLNPFETCLSLCEKMPDYKIQVRFL